MNNAELSARMLHALGKDLDFFFANAHPDLVLEFPYAPWVGAPERVAGRENTEPYLKWVGQILPGLTFTDVIVRPLAEPDAFLMEYKSTCPKANNYNQRYITITRFKDGKLILFREYWNTTEAARCFGSASEIADAAAAR